MDKDGSPLTVDTPIIGKRESYDLSVSDARSLFGSGGEELVDYFQKFGQGSLCGELIFAVSENQIPAKVKLSGWSCGGSIQTDAHLEIVEPIQTSWGFGLGYGLDSGLTATYYALDFHSQSFWAHKTLYEAIESLCVNAGRPNLLRFPYYVTALCDYNMDYIRIGPSFGANYSEKCAAMFSKWKVFQEVSEMGVHSRFLSPSHSLCGYILSGVAMGDHSVGQLVYWAADHVDESTLYSELQLFLDGVTNE